MTEPREQRGQERSFADIVREAPTVTEAAGALTTTLVGRVLRSDTEGKFVLLTPEGQTLELDIDDVRSHRPVQAGSEGMVQVEVPTDRLQAVKPPWWEKLPWLEKRPWWDKQPWRDKVWEDPTLVEQPGGTLAEQIGPGQPGGPVMQTFAAQAAPGAAAIKPMYDKQPWWEKQPWWDKRPWWDKQPWRDKVWEDPTLVEQPGGTLAEQIGPGQPGGPVMQTFAAQAAPAAAAIKPMYDKQPWWEKQPWWDKRPWWDKLPWRDKVWEDPTLVETGGTLQEGIGGGIPGGPVMQGEAAPFVLATPHHALRAMYAAQNFGWGV